MKAVSSKIYKHSAKGEEGYRNRRSVTLFCSVRPEEARERRLEGFFFRDSKNYKSSIKGDKNLIINPSRRCAPQDERNKKMNKKIRKRTHLHGYYLQQAYLSVQKYVDIFVSQPVAQVI
jgi:hypothetical protein